MFSKYNNHVILKPIVRSSSETKEQSGPKLNYHFTQRRERSESKGKEPQIQQSSPRIIKSEIVTRTTFKPRLPEIKFNHQLEKSSSNQELAQSQRHKRIVIQNKLPPKPQQAPVKRIFTHASYSAVGYEGLNPKQNNQDQEFSIQMSQSEAAYCVMDGHGMDGHLVSQFVKQELQQLVSTSIKLFDFKEVYQELQNRIKMSKTFGSQYSGTTVTMVIVREDTIFCGWLGDSRAVLCRKGDANYNAIELSHDHKPNLPSEKMRIEQNGGLVDTYYTMNNMPIGPHRVYVRGMQIPGLAMSRCLGDQLASSVGVSQVPDIKTMALQKNDLFFIIASDGVWEFLSNQMVVDIILPFYQKNDPQGACQAVYKKSYESWRQHNEGVDDITMIIVFINQQ